MKTKNILVIGSLNIDLVTNVQTMPLIGETVLGDGLSYINGGKGANQAYAAAQADGNVTMLGCVGADDFGRAQVENILAAGVDTFRIKKSKTSPTGTAIIYVDKNANNSIVVIPGANNDCDVAYLKEHDDALMGCDYLVLQMEIPWESVQYAIRRANELGKTILLNPAPVLGPLPDEIYPLIDYITPNETELANLTRRPVRTLEEAESGAKILLGKGVKHVLVTMGEAGMYYLSDKSAQLFNARKVTAVDTTAAGDCFNAAFAVALSEGKSEGEAIIFANTASSICVTRKGAQPSIPLRQEIEDALGLAADNQVYEVRL